jgi:hypothetical protein
VVRVAAQRGHPAGRLAARHLRRGQLSIEEIVDGYAATCRPLPDMFVDYLRERQPGLDYKTIRSLATKLILLFWKDLELRASRHRLTAP